MPDTPEGKIQMAKLTQKLDDHIATQATDMSEIKTGLTRIEVKLDSKADRDAIDKLSQASEAKVDRDAIVPLKEKVDALDARFWWMVTAIVLAFLGLIVDYIFKK